MDTRDLHKHLDTRFDRIEEKLDNHLERLSKAEVTIEWLRGHSKIYITIILATVGFLLTQLFRMKGN